MRVYERSPAENAAIVPNLDRYLMIAQSQYQFFAI